MGVARTSSVSQVTSTPGAESNANARDTNPPPSSVLVINTGAPAKDCCSSTRRLSLLAHAWFIGWLVFLLICLLSARPSERQRNGSRVHATGGSLYDVILTFGLP